MYLTMYTQQDCSLTSLQGFSPLQTSWTRRILKNVLLLRVTVTVIRSSLTTCSIPTCTHRFVKPNGLPAFHEAQRHRHSQYDCGTRLAAPDWKLVIHSLTPIRHAHLQGSSVHPSIDCVLCTNAPHSYLEVLTLQHLYLPTSCQSAHGQILPPASKWVSPMVWSQIRNHRYTLSIASQLATPANLCSQVIPMDGPTHCCLQDRLAQLSPLQRRFYSYLCRWSFWWWPIFRL